MMIVLLIFLIILFIAAYLIDIFVLHNSPTENLVDMLLLLGSISIAYGRLYVWRKQNLEKIEKAYQERIGDAFFQKKSAKRKLLLALMAYNKNKNKKCLKLLTKLQPKAETSQEKQVLYLFSACCLDEMGMMEGALYYYRRVLRENPYHATALSNMSILFRQKGDYRTGLEFAKRAVNCDPNNPYAYNNLGNLYLWNYEPLKAIEAGKKALELKPDFRQAATLLAITCNLMEDPVGTEQYSKLAVIGGDTYANLLEATNYYRKYYHAHEEELNKVKDWVQQTEIPAIHFTLKGDSGKSIVGGTINEPAPLSSEGQPMKLLAAIFFSELPENDMFPSQGVLRFYITPDEYYGADFDGLGEDCLSKQRNFRVLFDSKEEEYETQMASESQEPDEDFPVVGSYRLAFSLTKNPMPSCDYRFDDLYASLKEKGRDLPDIDTLIEEISLMGIEGHKMGGYAYFTQDDPRYKDKFYNKYDTLLFQLVSEYDENEPETVSFGDGGACGFFIQGDKLSQGDFSDILYSWDCF